MLNHAISLLSHPERDPLRSVRAWYGFLGDLLDRSSGGSGMYNPGLWERPGDTPLDAQRRLVDALIDDLPDGRWVDVGCGAGGAALRIAERRPGVHLTGVTVLADHVEAARARAAGSGAADRLSFQEGEASALPWKRGTVDAVISVGAAHHFPRKEEFVHQAGQILRPGGRLAVFDVSERIRPGKGALWEGMLPRALAAPSLANGEAWADWALRRGFVDPRLEDWSPGVLAGLPRWIHQIEAAGLGSTRRGKLAKYFLQRLLDAGDDGPLVFWRFTATRGDGEA